MTASLKYSDLTMREKAIVDALRLLDGPERNREQNFLTIVSGYRARVAELIPYIMHKHGCGLEALGECDCGLDAVLAGGAPTPLLCSHCNDVLDPDEANCCAACDRQDTPHPDTVRLEKLAKDLNEYRKCAHGRKITNESGASRLYNWWIDIPTNITADDLRAYIDGLEG